MENHYPKEGISTETLQGTVSGPVLFTIFKTDLEEKYNHGWQRSWRDVTYDVLLTVRKYVLQKRLKHFKSDPPKMRNITKALLFEELPETSGHMDYLVLQCSKCSHGVERVGEREREKEEQGGQANEGFLVCLAILSSLWSPRHARNHSLQSWDQETEGQVHGESAHWPSALLFHTWREEGDRTTGLSKSHCTPHREAHWCRFSNIKVLWQGAAGLSIAWNALNLKHSKLEWNLERFKFMPACSFCEIIGKSQWNIGSFSHFWIMDLAYLITLVLLKMLLHYYDTMSKFWRPHFKKAD